MPEIKHHKELLSELSEELDRLKKANHSLYVEVEEILKRAVQRAKS